MAWSGYPDSTLKVLRLQFASVKAEPLKLGETHKMSSTIDWPGQSDKTYRYWFLSSLKAADIKRVGGNYAFVKQLENGNYAPLYFGQTDNLSERISSHELWPEALRLGATDVMTHTTPAGESARLSEESDLIARWNPILNRQHRTAR
jgi:hypothetical protein